MANVLVHSPLYVFDRDLKRPLGFGFSTHGKRIWEGNCWEMAEYILQVHSKFGHIKSIFVTNTKNNTKIIMVLRRRGWSGLSIFEPIRE